MPDSCPLFNLAQLLSGSKILLLTILDDSQKFSNGSILLVGLRDFGKPPVTNLLLVLLFTTIDQFWRNRNG